MRVRCLITKYRKCRLTFAVGSKEDDAHIGGGEARDLCLDRLKVDVLRAGFEGRDQWAIAAIGYVNWRNRTECRCTYTPSMNGLCGAMSGLSLVKSKDVCADRDHDQVGGI